MALTVTDAASGPPLEWESNQAAGPTAVAGARVNPGLVMKVVTIAFDSSYPTGGEALAAADVGLTAITHVACTNTGGYAFEYNHSTAKLQAYWGDWNAVADGPLAEVADATNLSAIVPKALIFGY